MTRVPPSRPPPAAAPVPAAKRPQGAKAQAVQRAPQKATIWRAGQAPKPVKVKTGQASTEQHVEAPPAEGPKPGEAGAAHDPHLHAHLAEAFAPESHADQAEDKKAKDEVHEANERAESGGEKKHEKGFLKQIKPALKPPQANVAQKKDGFEQQALKSQLAQAQAQAAQAKQVAQAKPAAPVKAASQTQGTSPTTARPPDAFAVLHAAQDPGVFFKEEGHHGAAEQADPELSAAIEETIRLLFGVRGILRVSGGFNQAEEPAIIVVASQGFGEASLKQIPPKVHRYETILAVPYDLLPLKRERP